MHVSSETLLRWHTALERPDTRGPVLRELFQCYLDAMRAECVQSRMALEATHGGEPQLELEIGSGALPSDRDERTEAAA